ncbi:MAG TPA: M28 family metallopeptidase [bacterium]|nr:M28 family metallopeptidase [bacterium]
MKRFFWLIPLLVIAVAPQLGAQPAPPLTIPAASPQSALAHVTALAKEIGPRAAGTEGDRKAIDYVAEQFRRLGYGVERQAFPFRFFEETQAPQLTGAAPAAQRLSPVTMLYSSSTPEAGIDAEVVAAGLGRQGDFIGRAVEGKIALIERGEIFFSDKVANAAAADAAAVVLYNNQPGPPTVGTLRGPSRIPALIISQEEGRALLRKLEGGAVRLRMVVRTISETRTSFNVIGIKRGARQPNEIVVVGGHRDSVPVSPGANDNASGTAAVIEAARILAPIRTARTLHFVAFGAEELGLVGSAHYAQNPAGTIVGMVNMDMVGRGPLAVGNSNDDNRLADLGEQVARRLGLQVGRFKLRGTAGSDHFSFERIGVPTAFLHTGDDPAIHTPNDVLERVDPALIAQAARLAAGIALDAAGGAVR